MIRNINKQVIKKETARERLRAIFATRYNPINIHAKVYYNIENNYRFYESLM